MIRPDPGGDSRAVVITGASGGIGAALARAVARRGWSVVLAARRADALGAVARECGPRAHAIVADLTVQADADRLREETLARVGRLDAWINNVGRGITRLPSALTPEDIEEMMRANVLSALYGMQAVMPWFQARGHGHLINVSSMLGRIPHRTVRAAYSGAKHFLNALTAAWRDEIATAHPGVMISLVSPGAVVTEFGANALHGGAASSSLPGAQSPDEVAAVIADLLERPRPDVYTAPGSRDRVLDYFAGLGEDP